MLSKKLQMLAQIVGCVTIALLAIYGLLMILGVDSLAWAARDQASLSGVPNVINYQGMLRQPDGSVINGSYTMTFRLYDSPTADIADAVHTEELTNTVVRDGLFTVLLGDIQPIDAAAFQQPLYVGIQVENDAEMQPRQRIAPVPYAVQLTDGIYVDGDGNVGVGTTAPDTKLHIGVAPDASLTGGGGLVIGPTDHITKGNIVIDGNEIMARLNGATSQLYLQAEGGNLNVGGNLDVDGKLSGNGHVVKYHYHRPLTNYAACEWRYQTGYELSDYVCGLTGFVAVNGDIDECSDFDTRAEMNLYGDPWKWEARFEASCDEEFDSVYVSYLCIPSSLVDWGWPD